VGAFFTVLTIQRRQELAVLRAMGASTRYLLRDSPVQSFVRLIVLGLAGAGVAVLRVTRIDPLTALGGSR
jgi:putative ABC transport system permease protein